MMMKMKTKTRINRRKRNRNQVKIRVRKSRRVKMKRKTSRLLIRALNLHLRHRLHRPLLRLHLQKQKPRMLSYQRFSILYLIPLPLSHLLLHPLAILQLRPALFPFPLQPLPYLHPLSYLHCPLSHRARLGGIASVS